ncbi:MAG: type II toxin-antitoxin system PemK/MazF family toxin [Saprospiraceae bacterium]|nr:type II toxin-antitoxin system PemK/MazF family toxin [Saprospiraceae bacterium]MBK6782667.1 type II toxin-antitoxin system PemK/MazF family toxin [Saprospiraceae bacterium]MBK7523132.1 type II toxin-antitoxin system PemK/MazF family toxin [Saprospiraceae bacterium]MBK8079228.1 type II toxin-antitoxin system PemK/MazF family toxin [Saprospiraceae bacterium]MBK8370799.1 type II toxin-antitoxin system PemK/MazF family toxin [Saprospiraceae bacterium]
MKINQYEIVLVNLEPTLGSEISKTRPCVVISPDEMNHFLKTIVIAPITSTLKKYPTRINIISDKIKGMVAIDQIRTIDKQRITKIIGILEADTIDQIKSTIEETYVK